MKNIMDTISTSYSAHVASCLASIPLEKRCKSTFSHGQTPLNKQLTRYFKKLSITQYEEILHYPISSYLLEKSLVYSTSKKALL